MSQPHIGFLFFDDIHKDYHPLEPATVTSAGVLMLITGQFRGSFSTLHVTILQAGENRRVWQRDGGVLLNITARLLARTAL